jgi:hypothetical protein
MNILELLHYAFINQSKVEFSHNITQLNIKVIMFADTLMEKQLEQSLPLADHCYDEKIQDCIRYCVGKLKEQSLTSNLRTLNQLVVGDKFIIVASDMYCEVLKKKVVTVSLNDSGSGEKKIVFEVTKINPKSILLRTITSSIYDDDRKVIHSYRIRLLEKNNNDVLVNLISSNQLKLLV